MQQQFREKRDIAEVEDAPVDALAAVGCTLETKHILWFDSIYAVLGGSKRDGARRGLVTIVQLIDPYSCIFQSAVYGRLIYTLIYLSDRLLNQANPNPRLPPPPDLRRCTV